MSPEPVLVIGTSVRALAQMAKRAGQPVVAIDAFADCDTRESALSTSSVAVDADYRFAREPLIAAVEGAAARWNPKAAVLASGFEAVPERIDDIARIVPVAGNRASRVRRVKDPFALAACLEALGVPHPRTQPELPVDARGWLVKQRGGTGGGHVRCAPTSGTLLPDEYAQRRVAGEPVSVLFLADGGQARLVGANRFWTRGKESRLPFMFAGAASLSLGALPFGAEIGAAVAALTATTGLVGLNGVDCLVAEDRWWLIDVNPRPTATAELHDGRWAGGLFPAHLAAARGELSGDARVGVSDTRGFEIVYAPRLLRIPQDAAWPEWVTDRPRGGSFVAADEPVCTVHAEGNDLITVRRELAQRATAVLGRLTAKAA